MIKVNKKTTVIFFLMLLLGTALAGCENNPGATDCSILNESQCSSSTSQAQFGCAYLFYNCSGSAIGCASSRFQSSQTECESQAGCEWSYCSGTVSNCINLNNQTDCGNTDDCTWSESCSGTPTACRSFPGTQCESHTGCRTEGCKGQTVFYDKACAEYTNNTECVEHTGTPYCWWSSECLDDGRPGCSSFGDSGTCESEGCDWSEACSGNAVPCTDFTALGSCHGQPGCSWNGSSTSMCSGTVESCASLSSESACTAQKTSTGTCQPNFLCQGNPDSCTSFDSDETKCEQQIGCSWEDTPVCTPNCTGKECGPDGCGSTCGAGCGTNETCNNGTCVSSCGTSKDCDYYYALNTCGYSLDDGCEGEIDCLNPGPVSGLERCCYAALKNINYANTCPPGKCGTGLDNGCVEYILECNCGAGQYCSETEDGKLGDCLDLPCQTDQDCIEEHGTGWHCTQNDCEQDCSTDWQCSQDNTQRIKKNTDCSIDQTENCPGGCSNGECVAQTCNDGTEYGKCSTNINNRAMWCNPSTGQLEYSCHDKCPACAMNIQQCNTSTGQCEAVCSNQQESCGCDDGTNYGECSSSNPGKYCDDVVKTLINACPSCPCGTGFHCTASAECIADCSETRECNGEGNITLTHSDCSQSTINCDYGCSFGYCDCSDGTKHGQTNASGQSCDNGTLSEPQQPTETCSIYTWECNGSFRQKKNADCSWNEESAVNCTHGCYNGECKCSDGTKHGKCSNNEPLKCDNGSLEIDCGCCPSGEHCDSRNECVPDCDEEWICIENDSKVAHKLKNCSLTDISVCVNGCSNGACIGTNCVPQTCSEIGLECGSAEQCGNQITCGECSEFSACINNKCEPKTAEEICGIKQWDCGTNQAGGQNVDCGSCNINEECSENKCKSTLACSDGTIFGTCSASKPDYCSFGIVEKKCEFCGCPPGKECTETGTCKNTNKKCVDGSSYGTCSGEKPAYCDSYGTVRENCGECGCPEHTKCDEKTGKCTSALPEDCGLLEHESCQEYFKPLYCFNGKTSMHCQGCGCDASLNCNYSSGRCQRKKTARIKIVSDSEKCNRRKECIVLFDLLDSENNHIPSANISSGPTAKIQGKKLELKRTGNKTYTIVIEPGFRESDSVEISFSAQIRLESVFPLDQNIKLLFENEKIAGKIKFEKESFRQGEKIGKIIFSPKYSSGEKISSGAFTASIESGKFKTEKKLEWKNNALECFFDYPLNEKDALNSVGISITGTDLYGNRINEKYLVPAETGKNPEFHLDITGVNDVHSFGSKLLIKAVSKPESESTKAFVYSTALDFNKEMSFDKTGKAFFLNLVLPDVNSGIKQVDLAFTGIAGKQEKKLNYSENFIISLTGDINIGFIHPGEGTTLSEKGTVEKIIVALNTGQNSRSRNEKIKALLAVDGVSREIELLLDEETGLHQHSLSSPLEKGKHSISIELTDGFTGKKTIETEIIPVLPVPIILGLAALLVLCLAVLVYTKKEFGKKHEQLEGRKKSLSKKKTELKNLRRDFFTRKISEKEYKKLSLKLGAEIKEISSGGNKHTEKNSFLKNIDEVEERIQKIKEQRERGGK